MRKKRVVQWWQNEEPRGQWWLEEGRRMSWLERKCVREVAWRGNVREERTEKLHRRVECRGTCGVDQEWTDHAGHR